MHPSEIIDFLGDDYDNFFNAKAYPLIQTSNFCFPTIQKMRQALNNKFYILVYSRGNNPTIKILSKKLAAIEKAEEWIMTASGCTAYSLAILSNINVKY